MSERVNPEGALRDAATTWTPPEPLRARVMGAAEPGIRPSVSWSDRLWFSRRWRLAAGATAVAMAALDFAFGGRAPSPVGPHESARATAQAVDEAARQAGLGAEQARVFAQRAFALASRPEPDATREFGGGIGSGDMK
jgi:hypothetical protein